MRTLGKIMKAARSLKQTTKEGDYVLSWEITEQPRMLQREKALLIYSFGGK